MRRCDAFSNVLLMCWIHLRRESAIIFPPRVRHKTHKHHKLFWFSTHFYTNDKWHDGMNFWLKVNIKWNMLSKIISVFSRYQPEAIHDVACTNVTLQSQKMDWHSRKIINSEQNLTKIIPQGQNITNKSITQVALFSNLYLIVPNIPVLVWYENIEINYIGFSNYEANDERKKDIK